MFSLYFGELRKRTFHSHWFYLEQKETTNLKEVV